MKHYYGTATPATDAKRRYNETHYERIGLYVPNGTKEALKNALALDPIHPSINGLLLALVRDYLAEMTRKNPQYTPDPLENTEQ